MRVAAVRGVDGVKPVADQPAFNRALGDLIGRIPLGLVAHRRHVEAVGNRPLAVTQHRVDFPKIVRMHEGAVVMLQFQAVKKVAVGQLWRSRQQGAPVSVLSKSQLGDAPRQRVGVSDADRAGRREVALARVVRSLLVLEAGRELGDDEVEVGPALSVRMRALIDQHAVDRRAQVGAMIEIEPAQVKLIGLAFAAMLADDQSGRRLEQFAGAIHRPGLQLLLRHGAHAGRIRHADLAGRRP